MLAFDGLHDGWRTISYSNVHHHACQGETGAGTWRRMARARLPRHQGGENEKGESLALRRWKGTSASYSKPAASQGANWVETDASSSAQSLSSPLVFNHGDAAGVHNISNSSSRIRYPSSHRRFGDTRKGRRQHFARIL